MESSLLTKSGGRIVATTAELRSRDLRRQLVGLPRERASINKDDSGRHNESNLLEIGRDPFAVLPPATVLGLLANPRPQFPHQPLHLLVLAHRALGVLH